jgi:hypothetical protein
LVLICIYDEETGQGRWAVWGGGQASVEGYTYSSSSIGCAHNMVGVISQYYGGNYNGGSSIVRSLYWPCNFNNRLWQPAGELRARTVLQRWNGSSWVGCQDTGYFYSNTSSYSWMVGFNMFSAPDCGVASYRNWGYGSFYQSGAWRGTYRISPSMYMN